MIPKIIHYCWFGGKQKPKLERKCIASWKKFCPDYQIIEWNESNFDLTSAPLFVRQAIEAKKWAFATDYVRLKVVYDYGGVYMDTDVELLKPLDTLLKNKVFFGFQYANSIGTGLGFGSEKHNAILPELMAEYETAAFKLAKGNYNQTSNVVKDTQVLVRHGLVLDGKEQLLEGTIRIYPADYFNPKRWNEKDLHLTENTVSIHWCSHSWWNNVWIYRVFGSRKMYRIFMNIVSFPKKTASRLLGKERYERMKWKLKSIGK